MKISVIARDQGIKREIDFQDATLPDGRSIVGILDENEGFKEEIKDLNEKTSFLSRIIPWKWVRDVVEIILIIFGAYGIYTVVKGLI